MRSSAVMLDDEAKRSAQSTTTSSLAAPSKRVARPGLDRDTETAAACEAVSWRGSTERRVWTESVVPADVRVDLATKRRTLEGHGDPAEALVLERADESLDESDAALLPDGAEARPNAPALAPGEILALELHTAIGDEMSGRASGVENRAVE